MFGPWVYWPKPQDNEQDTNFKNVTSMLQRLRRKYEKLYWSQNEPESSILALSGKDVHRLHLAGESIKQQISFRQIVDSIPHDMPFNPFGNPELHRYGSRMLTFREPNWTGVPDLLDAFEYFGKLGLFLVGLLIAIVFTFLPGAYGCVHYAAIDIGFPTTLEHILWKVSCFLLLGFSALLPAIFGICLAFGIPILLLTLI